MICHWAINRTDSQNSLSMTLDVLLQLQYNFLVCKLMSSSSNTLPVYSGFLVHFLRTSYLMTSFHSEIHDYLMTGDQSAIHKLKPRSFIKSYSTLTLFTLYQSLLLEFPLSLSNIPLQCSTLYHDLTKQLSYYLYLLYFFFFFSFSFRLTIQKRVQKSVTSQVSQVTVTW